ncbi:ABC transporter permease [Myxacorys almedinensis]|uniref:Iron export ABC transporter permease subunit FetB n=1 Tax=Myxacorys almedinensis A TaxID=2690445 RepID=A0A8J7Z178_9CYAN|nr:iron export ABC transporter permease subunit FetB [Myxacorys almedinensis]NDJ17290.1 iron export ABC transporter permease subunit FetB [Myxacorys almedinensis A]
MESSYIPISNTQLALSAALIVINIGLSWALRLGLERQLWIASFRMVVQLLLVGLVLQWVFTLRDPLWVLFVMLLMTSMAGISAVNRTRRRYRSIYWNSFLSILLAAFTVTSLTVNGIIQAPLWYDPQYFIPLLGMVLGNALTGTSLALDRFMEDLASRRDQIEALLTLGATRWEAAHNTIRDALRTGMIPTINSMMVMGIVSLPGMMTGQILAGASPSEAVRYQIVIIFAIAAGTALTTITIIVLSFYALFNSSHQLCLERLQTVR